MTPKVYTQEAIKKLLLTNDEAVERGVVAIWEKQTSSERLSQSTVEHNGVGFNGVDAQFLSSLAEQLAWRNRGFSPKQLFYARKAILKYARQLTEIANEKSILADKIQQAGREAQIDLELSL